jgi:hypothetical protein
MKEMTVHLSETEYEWVKSKGNNYLRHLVQFTMKMEVFFAPTFVIHEPLPPIRWNREREVIGEVGPDDYKGAGQ